MNIEVNISTQNENTDGENDQYLESVYSELEKEFPDAHISVELVNCDLDATTTVSHDPNGEIKNRVEEITQACW